MTTPLILCSCCHRHIRATETSCPFCHATRRKTLGALAIGAAVLASACVGCGSDDTPGPGEERDAATEASAGNGGSGGAMPDAETDSATDAANDALGGSAGMSTAYGPPPDASPIPDATDDAFDSAGGMQGAYGPPPFDAAYGPPPDTDH